MTDRSPFECGNIVSMYLQPIHNDYYRTYQNIITLSAMPKGPLQDLVAHINTTPLSEFQAVGPWNPTDDNPFNPRCLYALLRYPKNSIQSSVKNGRYYMFAEDVPNIYGYLESHGYQILDTPYWRGDLYSSGNRRLVTRFRYQE